MTERDGYNLAIEYNVTDFPCVAIVCPGIKPLSCPSLLLSDHQWLTHLRDRHFCLSGIPAATVIFRAAGKDVMVEPKTLITRMGRAIAANEEVHVIVIQPLTAETFY